MSNIIYTSSNRADVEETLRNLPAILEGTHPDPHGIAESLRSRVAFGFLDLVADAFEQKGRGYTGSDGIKWAPLSSQYLAYSRPLAGRQKPRAGKHAPGGNDGLLSDAQLRLWRKTFSTNVRRLAGKYEIRDAKARAAAMAWKTVKEAGGKTKLASPKFGGRIAGKDYQIHVVSGTFRRTIQPGTLTVNANGGADYFTSEPDQVVENTSATTMVVGSKFPHAEPLHKIRPLWPEELPLEWQDELSDAITSGILMFVMLVQRGEI